MRHGRPAKQRVWLGPGRYRGCCRDAVANPVADSYANSNSYTFCMQRGDGDANTYGHSDNDGNCNCYANSDSHSDCYTDCDSYAYAKAGADTKASSNAAASPVSPDSPSDQPATPEPWRRRVKGDQL